MCGRFLISEQSVKDAGEIAEIPRWIQGELKLGTIFPSMKSLVLTRKDGQIEGTLMPFGFQSETMKKRIINARSETVDSKWMFKFAFRHHRCATVCSAFYEWDADREKIEFTWNQGTMYLASVVVDDSFVILTKPANASMEPFHPRMPIVLNAQQAKEWISGSVSPFSLMEHASPVFDHSEKLTQISLFEGGF